MSIEQERVWRTDIAKNRILKLCNIKLKEVSSGATAEKLWEYSQKVDIANRILAGTASQDDIDFALNEPAAVIAGITNAEKIANIWIVKRNEAMEKAQRINKFKVDSFSALDNYEDDEIEAFTESLIADFNQSTA